LRNSPKDGGAVLPARGPPGSLNEPVVAAFDNPGSGRPDNGIIYYVILN